MRLGMCHARKRTWGTSVRTDVGVNASFLAQEREKRDDNVQNVVVSSDLPHPQRFLFDYNDLTRGEKAGSSCFPTNQPATRFRRRELIQR